MTAGLGYRPRGTDPALLGIGFGWANPSDLARDINPRAGSQYTGEIFYRFQMTPNLAITPNLQFVANPSLNLDEDALWIGGIRARLTF